MPRSLHRQKKTAPSTSRVGRYYVMDADGNILTYVDQTDKQEHPTWFMGYQLQKIPEGKMERSKTYDAKKVAREKKAQASKDAEAKQSRRMAKEGLDLDDKSMLTRGRTRGSTRRG